MDLPATHSEASPGFWRRQFQLPATAEQSWFDFCFGIIAPVLCVFFDPAVFRSSGMMGGGMLSYLRLFGYLEIGAGTAALGYYLLTRRGSLLLAGALCGGALFSFLVGLGILPLTILGLLFIVGVFGFTPFASGFVFLRNGFRCWRVSSPRFPRATARFRVVLGSVLFLGVPMGLQLAISNMAHRALTALQSGSEHDFGHALQTLKYLRFASDANTDEIAFAYQKATDEKRRERLARAYQTLTGRSVEERLAELND